MRVIPPGERPRADGGAGREASPAERSGVRVIPPGERRAEADVVVAGNGNGESVRVVQPRSGMADGEGAEPPEAEPEIVRHVLRDTPLDPLPRPADSGTAFAGRRFIVVDDGCGIALELADVLGRYGARVRTPLEVDGPCDGLVHLGRCVRRGRRCCRRRTRACAGRCWAVCGGSSRSAARARTSRRPFGGGAGEPGPGAGLRGLARTVAREFPETMVRAVDVDTGETPRMIALRIMAELLAGTPPVTVGYEGERRRTPALVRTELDGDARVPVGADGVVLLTGGARGVPARVARGLAATTGCHLEIVGRTPEPVGRTVFSEAVDEASLRRVLVAEGTRGPEEIEETIRRILAEREVQENLDALHMQAASVRYHSGDVRDARFVRNVIEDVYGRHGRLDGVVHGAGIAEERLVRDKSPESFERAYRTKVDGASALAAAVRPDTGFFVVLGAAAGERLPADRAGGRRRLRRARAGVARAAARAGARRRPGPAAGRRARDRGAVPRDRARRRDASRVHGAGPVTEEPIAIVGAGAVFPGAGSAAELWRNVLAGFDAISDVPPGRWDPALYYDPGAYGRAPESDRFYCRRGGFVDDVATFDPARFGIEPAAVAAMDPDRLLALRTAAEAIADAGGDDRLPDRERIGVVLGRGGHITPGAPGPTSGS
ncbi:hypothetical protein BJF79_23800 [Actinomadura sp. CNU-125]|uniref:SDR family NAD(P)-dependent oxidoreductase n=1 Tax=Actinomadura sp. CNU-125 TaxID=1904961 RepID=UPI00095AB9CD|nr:SDR family NAD(P)-dependent oxidoreductase [Actinomadura sp. CNU-125]OLT11589.1 hypothetical protein BJF79_23800 [Actinomadura sp. CNU-125]